MNKKSNLNKKVFNYGDTIYFLDDSKIKSAKVKEVTYQVDEDTFVYDSEAFASKEELIKSLEN